MTILTVRHITTYQYKQPVSFGEHRMMLRPRESHDQRLLESKLSALAVFRLMTSSNFVDCITGRSAGFSPLTGSQKSWMKKASAYGI
jgi:Bacterial transglutaminase-like N-terminal region